MSKKIQLDLQRAFENEVARYKPFLKQSGQLWINLLSNHYGIDPVIVVPGLKFDQSGQSHLIYQMGIIGRDNVKSFARLLDDLYRLNEKTNGIKCMCNPNEGTIRFNNITDVLRFFTTLNDHGYNITAQSFDLKNPEIPDGSNEVQKLRYMTHEKAMATLAALNPK